MLLLLVPDTQCSSNVKHLEALPGPLPAVNQLELHPWCQQREVVDYCSEKGIVLQAFCPLVRIRKDKFEDPVVVKVAKKHERAEAHILLRWSLQKGWVHTSFWRRRNQSVWQNSQRFIPIPKASSAERIEANKDLYNFELDSEDMEELDGLDQGASGRVSGIDPAHLPDWCAINFVVVIDAVYILNPVTVSHVYLVDQWLQLEVHDSSSIAKNSCVKSVVSVHSAEFYGTSHSPKAPPFMSTTEKNLKASNLTDFCMGVAFLVPLQQWMNGWKYLGEGNIQI